MLASLLGTCGWRCGGLHLDLLVGFAATCDRVANVGDSTTEVCESMKYAISFESFWSCGEVNSFVLGVDSTKSEPVSPRP